MCTHGIGASTPLYMDAVSVNGRDGAIRCSICINIYLAPLRRALREMGARLPSSPMCLPVPRSRYAGFPREDVPLVLRTGLPSESLPLPPPRRVPPRLLCPLARAFALPATLVEPSRLTSSPAARHDRSAGIIRRVNGRRYCMQDQPRVASCTRTDAPRFRGLPPPLRPSLASPSVFLAEETATDARFGPMNV